MNKQGISIPFILRNFDRPIPPLDYLPFTTDLASAWSTQRVVISGYFGDLVLLRRSSDNDEMGFSYDAITGDVDNIAIDAWAGVDQVFYVKIYDQNGANDYVQTTTSLQPERINDRAFSNDDKMMIMTSTITNENVTMLDRCEATISTAGNRTNWSDTINNPPFKIFLHNAQPAGMTLFLGYTTSGNNYYRNTHLVTPPLDTILGYGVGGSQDNNLMAMNASTQEDKIPTTIGSPTTYFTTTNVSWFYKTSYAATYRGYIDERFHYTELLSSTNYGTVRDYINTKYSVY